MAKQKNQTTRGRETNKSSWHDTSRADDPGTQLVAAPFGLVRRFSEEMNNLFQDFGLGRNWLTTDLPGGLWSPQVEVFESDGKLVVRADLPGMKREDINVELSDDGLTIEGERTNEHEEKREGYYRSERSYGKFYRRVPLPDGAKIQNAEASFRNGVLEITMPAPKQETTKSRRLQIHGEGQQLAKGKAA